MKSFVCAIALLSLTLVSGQRSAGNSYGAPQPSRPFNPAPQPQPQPTYSQTSSGRLPQGQGQRASGGDHQGLDWLLESVPGTPGTDYPIYRQDELDQFQFDCTNEVEGGYYADPAAQCQAFHVCVPDGLGSMSALSFLCPNGTIFNQEYFICDWWFNFDCSQATGLYSRNNEVAAEREAASLAQSSNVRNTYTPSNNQPARQQPARQQPARQPQNNYNQPSTFQSNNLPSYSN